jgi:hypothetical protein
MSKTELSGLLIDLDCLLDTRLSILFNLLDDGVGAILANGYHSRKEDAFDGVDTAAFRTHYRRRDKAVLKNAIATPLLQFVKEFALETYHNNINTPFNMLPKIILNIHPYVLSDEEINTIVKMLIMATGQFADIEVIDMSMEEITPRYLNYNVSVVVMYEYYKWLEHHSQTKAFKKTTCPDIMMIGPALYFNGLPSAVMQEKARRLNTTGFAAMETTAEPLIKLKLFPVSFFSIALGDGINPPELHAQEDDTSSKMD